MANWLNRHTGEILVAGLGVLGAAAIGFSYDLGQNATAIEGIQVDVANMGQDVRDLRTDIGGLRKDIGNLNAAMVSRFTKTDERFDDLERRINVDQSDLKSILLTTGVVEDSDVFYAAMIEDAVWVFPDEALDLKFVNRGMVQEAASWFLMGYRVLPAAAVMENR